MHTHARVTGSEPGHAYNHMGAVSLLRWLFSWQLGKDSGYPCHPVAATRGSLEALGWSLLFPSVLLVAQYCMLRGKLSIYVRSSIRQYHMRKVR